MSWCAQAFIFIATNTTNQHQIYIDMFDDLDDLLLDRVNQALREWVPGLEVLVALHALTCLAAAAAHRLSTMQHTHAQVVAVRTTKPRIPSIILVNYEKQESTRAKLLVLQQQQVPAQNTHALWWWLTCWPLSRCM